MVRESERDDPKVIEKYEQTADMYARADAIAKRFGASSHFEEHIDHGTLFGDAYLWPLLDRLESFLDALDEADVVYDHIDLPREEDLPDGLLAALKRRYPRGSGVNINVGYPAVS
jgi:hypothetical protein